MKTKAIVHLKIVLEWNGLESLLQCRKVFRTAYSYKNISVEGIYSHFATAESEDLTFTKLQLERFNEVLEYFNKYSISQSTIHNQTHSNSGAILQLPEANMDMVRPGIMLFGVYPSKK